MSAPTAIGDWRGTSVFSKLWSGLVVDSTRKPMSIPSTSFLKLMTKKDYREGELRDKAGDKVVINMS